MRTATNAMTSTRGNEIPAGLGTGSGIVRGAEGSLTRASPVSLVARREGMCLGDGRSDGASDGAGTAALPRSDTGIGGGRRTASMMGVPSPVKDAGGGGVDRIALRLISSEMAGICLVAFSCSDQPFTQRGMTHFPSGRRGDPHAEHRFLMCAVILYPSKVRRVGREQGTPLARVRQTRPCYTIHIYGFGFR